MKFETCLGLLAGGMLLVGIGCAQSPSVVRGQSPVVESAPPVEVAPPVEGPLIGTAPGYGEKPHLKHKHRDFKPFAQHRNPAFGFEGGYYNGAEAYYPNHQKRVYDVGDDGCPACDGGAACGPGGCQHCGHGCPHNYHTYSYKWPKNLVYPPPVLPAGMVQYPYYTLRGPTDFFMK